MVQFGKSSKFDQTQHDFEETMNKPQEEAVKIDFIHNISGEIDVANKADPEAADGAKASQKGGGSLDNTLEA